MNVSAAYDQIFGALLDADIAFARLREKGLERSDQDLSRDQDYLRLHKSGMHIALIGGQAAIHGAIVSICRLDGPEPDCSQIKIALERFWAGMGNWKH
ncbi:hypothetical protein [Phaeovulum sp.]|uniref:hypothetical protein n=1 Tax=Phaeovulum sp. TaxID=2934796 RepID=UPI0039E357A1